MLRKKKKKRFLMSFSKTSVMKIVKQISLTMTFKSVVLLSWFTVIFPPELPCAFSSVAQPGRQQLFGF